MAKTGKVAGLAGIKASLKTSFKEGMEQAAKNVDNFKVVLKNVDDFGKKVVTKIDDFGKQLDNLVTNKVSSLADNVAGKLRHADETLSTAAQNFRLNIGLEPQLIDGFMPTPPPGKLSGLADNIQAFAKSLDGSVEEVAKASDVLKEVLYGEHIIKGSHGKKLLAPNVIYVSEEGYEYTTDSLGRISSVNADNLVLETADRNLYSQRTVGGIDRLPEDDGGHLIASMFKGSGDIDNLVAMHKYVNRSGGEWYTMEQSWKEALEQGRKVSDIEIKPIYSGNSLRPDKFSISYTIEGKLPFKISIQNSI
ncbi:DNA/RNA non-specific endonuclease [Streptococcus suis]|uniref:DNA/RNA non-specific endonuclease n=1 Tax=Streptococcus suis TaxID=1307 RepID=UPI00298F8196|nr:DNA/RNA non-specific endonuclease [Streptococcus suis]